MGCSSALFMATQLALHTSFNYKDRWHGGQNKNRRLWAYARRTGRFHRRTPEISFKKLQLGEKQYVRFEGVCNPLEPGTDQDGLHPGLLLEFSPHTYARISEGPQLLEVE